jgi:uncharacterized protein (TIGR02598 family)
VKARIRKVVGFSLVEVALALAVLSFCLLILIGLLSEGVGTYRDAGAQSAMVDVATLVARDLQATPGSGTSPQYGFSIPAPGAGATGPKTVYVDATGTATATTVGAAPAANSIYRVSVYFIPPSAGQRIATLARIVITFPALADSTPASNPTMYSDIFQTIVSLNRN